MLNVLEQEFTKARAEGRAEGEDNLLKLFEAVAQAGKDVLEAIKMAKDPQQRQKLYAEYGIAVE